MRILFISRNSSHAKYYQKLVDKLSIDAKLHVTGKFRLGAIRHFSLLPDFDSEQMLANHLQRKRARHPKLFNVQVITYMYLKCMRIFESLRFLKFVDLLKHETPDKVVVWNGKKLPNQTVVCAANYLSIPVMYFENGLVPNTTCLDPCGVNFTASLPKCPEFYLNRVLNNAKLHQIEPISAHKKRQEKVTCTGLPEKYIFVPFQVPNDTQVVVHSPWIKSMEQLFYEVMAAIAQLNDPSIKVVFKEHPNWPTKYHHLYHAHPKAIFANGLNTAHLIQHAEAIITINSTVGMETLQLGGKLITLGEACYALPGIVLHARNLQELVLQLISVPDWEPDRRLITHFLDFVNGVYAIPQAWRRADKAHIKAVESRLLGNDEFSQSLIS